MCNLQTRRITTNCHIPHILTFSSALERFMPIDQKDNGCTLRLELNLWQIGVNNKINSIAQ